MVVFCQIVQYKGYSIKQLSLKYKLSSQMGKDYFDFLAHNCINCSKYFSIKLDVNAQINCLLHIMDRKAQRDCILLRDYFLISLMSRDSAICEEKGKCTSFCIKVTSFNAPSSDVKLSHLNGAEDVSPLNN